MGILLTGGETKVRRLASRISIPARRKLLQNYLSSPRFRLINSTNENLSRYLLASS